MTDSDLKLKVIDDILNNNLESRLFGSMNQISNFLDQLIIDISKEDFDKKELSKNMVNLKSFIDQSIFDSKIKIMINSMIEDKKKEMKESIQLDQKEEK